MLQMLFFERASDRRHERRSAHLQPLQGEEKCRLAAKVDVLISKQIARTKTEQSDASYASGSSCQCLTSVRAAESRCVRARDSESRQFLMSENA